PASHNFQLLNTLPSYRLLGIGVISRLRSRPQATGEQKAQACDIAWFRQLCRFAACEYSMEFVLILT
ncbi:MAG: hypothetical protein WCA20_22245, partial [Candidatus Sulfotelmatobacter sp.]